MWIEEASSSSPWPQPPIHYSALNGSKLVPKLCFILLIHLLPCALLQDFSSLRYSARNLCPFLNLIVSYFKSATWSSLFHQNMTTLGDCQNLPSARKSTSPSTHWRCIGLEKRDSRNNPIERKLVSSVVCGKHDLYLHWHVHSHLLQIEKRIVSERKERDLVLYLTWPTKHAFWLPSDLGHLHVHKQNISKGGVIRYIIELVFLNQGAWVFKEHNTLTPHLYGYCLEKQRSPLPYSWTKHVVLHLFRIFLM